MGESKTEGESLEDFAAEAEAFLAAHATRRQPDENFEWGKGSDRVAMFDEKDRAEEIADLRHACEWRRTKYDAGYGWISGPKRYGGRELPYAYQRAFDALEAQYQVPNQSYFTIGLGMVAPTIAAHASESAKQAYVAKMFRADIVGCQLFSEPAAGSDLASLQTKAEKDGEEWVITGQKVWTSGAHYSDIGEVIARTDPSLPKHKGLTGFIVNMRDPAVEIRPLRQMTGGSTFNEVFFNELRVPDDHRLGEVNNGWNVALTTLMNERAAIGAGGRGGSGLLSRTIEMTRAFGFNDDPVTRQMLADLIIHHRVASYNNQRAMDKVEAGGLPGPELSMAKLAGTMNMRRLGEFVAHVLGPKLVVDTGEWGTFAWSQLVLGTPGSRIAGGSDEVMRNIVGERVLGLPKDVGIDSTSPFSELRVNANPVGTAKAADPTRSIHASTS